MNTNFELREHGNLKIVEIPAFSQYSNLVHGFTTRVGGCGQTPYDSFNLALHVGDKAEDVSKNREELCRYAGVALSDMVTGEQVHSANVAIVTADHKGAGAHTYDTALSQTDALVTGEKRLLLATFCADCVPLLMFDPVKNVIASVHAGWLGTVHKIPANAIAEMKAKFGTDPKDCLVAIGPSIGPCCYEVDQKVIHIVKDQFANWPDLVKEGQNGKAMFDLWSANKTTVMEAGVPEKNISISGMCTCCNEDLLFSYRKSGGTTGRMAAFIMLK